MIETAIIKRFEYISKNYPNNIAIITKERKITYKTLNREANKLAHYLKNEKFLMKQGAIGIFIEPSKEMIISILAVQKLGLPYVPIDVSYPRERIKYMIEDSKILHTLSLRKNLKKIGFDFTNILFLDEIDYTGIKDTNLSIESNELMYILYTSGSTGVPKGVKVFQKGVANYLSYSCKNYLKQQKCNENPASFIYLPLSFDASITSLYTPLMEGRSVVIPSKHELEIFDDELVRENKFDFVKITPAHLILLRERLDIKDLKEWTNFLIIGGEALTLQHLLFLRKKEIDWTIINEYGPTETVVGSSTYFFKLDSDLPNDIPIGKPIYNTDIYIIDKNGDLLPDGEIGEIVIGGDGVAKGYMNKQELTNKSFLEDFLLQGNRVYKTGDLGVRLKDGNLLYKGRIDEQIKIRGYRIEILEIESSLRKISGVKDAVVVVKNNEDNIKHLEAFFTSEIDLDVILVKKELTKILPMYMLPSKISRIKEIPITSNGKINRKYLLGLNNSSNISKEKLNEIEKQLFRIWKETLEIEDININDSFTKLGGHSLLAVILISKINKLFSVDISILTLYPNGTLKEVAKAIQIQKQEEV